jgi:hypothetical protein
MYSSLARCSAVASRSEMKAIRVRATPRYWVRATMSSEAWWAQRARVVHAPAYFFASITCPALHE